MAHRDAVVAFLKEAAEKSGKTLAAIATEIGVSHTTLTRPVNNPDYKYLPKIGTLKKISTLTGVPLPGELTSNQDERSLVREILPLPVRGIVAAGMWQSVEALQDIPLGVAPMVEDQRYAGVPQWAELVRGASMNRSYEDGDLLHVVDSIAAGYNPTPGDDVIVERRQQQDGNVERTCKRLAILEGRLVLVGNSTIESWNQPLPLAGDESTTVEIIGLVLGSYRPRRR